MKRFIRTSLYAACVLAAGSGVSNLGAAGNRTSEVRPGIQSPLSGGVGFRNRVQLGFEGSALLTYFSS